MQRLVSALRVCSPASTRRRLAPGFATRVHANRRTYVGATRELDLSLSPVQVIGEG